MEIWFPGILLSAIASGVIVFILYRHNPDKTESNFEIRVYGKQLEELKQQFEEGLISSNELTQAKSELGRKILQSDKQFQKSQITNESQLDGYKLILSAIVVLTLIVGSQLIHNYLGSPGYSDQPINKRVETAKNLKDNRLSQVEYLKSLGGIETDEREIFDTIERLEQVNSQNAVDYQNVLRILIQASLAEDKLFLASQLNNHLVSILGDEATLDDLIYQVEIMIYSTQLYVSPEAEIVILDILDRDPQNLEARFYLGLMYEQVARPDFTFEIWSEILVDNSDTESPLLDYIKSHIGGVAQRAGVNLF